MAHVAQSTMALASARLLRSSCSGERSPPSGLWPAACALLLPPVPAAGGAPPSPAARSTARKLAACVASSPSSAATHFSGRVPAQCGHMMLTF